MQYLVVTFSIASLTVQVHANTRLIPWWLPAAHDVHFVVIPLVRCPRDRFSGRAIDFVGGLCVCSRGSSPSRGRAAGATRSSWSAVAIGLVFHGLVSAVRPAVTAVPLGYRVTSIVAGSLAPDHRRSPARNVQVPRADSWYPAGPRNLGASTWRPRARRRRGPPGDATTPRRTPIER